jgi:prepilin-type N-terminal cleavage/methylation domain-containing protein
MHGLPLMIHLKVKHAFTLIEVLITMAIIGITFGPIYFAQGTIFKRIVNSVAAVERMFVAYDFFVDKQRDDEIGDKRVIEKKDDPKTEMAYQMSPVAKESMLSKTCNHLFVQKASWKWQDLKMLHQDVFVSIIFNPPPKEEQKEQAQKGGPQVPGGKGEQQNGGTVKQGVAEKGNKDKLSRSP